MRTIVTILYLLVFTISLYGQDFVQHTITGRDVVNSYELADLDADGFKDVVVVYQKKFVRDSAGIGLFFLGKNGVSRTGHFSLPNAHVIFDIGNMDGDPYQELITLTSDGIHIFNLDTTAGIFRETDLIPHKTGILQLPSFAQLLRYQMIHDIGKGAISTILIPDAEQFSMFRADYTGIKKVTDLKVAGSATYQQRQKSAEREIGEFLDIVLNPANYKISDVNLDGLKDLVFYSSAELTIFLQKQNGFDPQPDYRSILLLRDTEGKPVILNRIDRERRERYYLLEIIDVNSDGILDALIKKQDSRQSLFDPNTQIQIYYGRLERGQLKYPETPDQIIVSEGYQFQVRIQDLDQDGKLDMAVPTMEMGLFKLVAVLVTRSVTVNIQFYKNNDGFPNIPTAIRDLSMSFEFSGSFNAPVFNYNSDFNGDGINDLITSPDDDMIGIHFGEQGAFFSQEPNEEYEIELPRNGQKVETADLNGDGLGDIIFKYDLQDDPDNDIRNLIRFYYHTGRKLTRSGE